MAVRGKFKNDDLFRFLSEWNVRYPFAGKIYNLDTILDNLTSICFKSRGSL